ncbi:MAG: AraC family transcriptional regulator [Candidatus Krumholzibacteriia bacterium]
MEERLEALQEPWTSFIIDFPTYPRVRSNGREESQLSQRVLFVCPQAEKNPTELCLALFGSQAVIRRLQNEGAAEELPGTRFVFVYAPELPADLRSALGTHHERPGAPVLITDKATVVLGAGYVNEILQRGFVPTAPGTRRAWPEGAGVAGTGLQQTEDETEIWRDPLPQIALVDEDGNRIMANTGLQDYRVEYACRYVLAHFRENINRDKMAEMVGLSPGYFSNLFRGEVGMSFSDYLIQVRIENAKSLLRRFDLSVEAISRQCGFNSLAHFSRTFKDRVGLSPLKYRKTPQSEAS